MRKKWKIGSVKNISTTPKGGKLKFTTLMDLTNYLFLIYKCAQINKSPSFLINRLISASFAEDIRKFKYFYVKAKKQAANDEELLEIIRRGKLKPDVEYEVIPVQDIQEKVEGNE